jgi:hypothetical protein
MSGKNEPILPWNKGLELLGKKAIKFVPTSET